MDAIYLPLCYITCTVLCCGAIDKRDKDKKNSQVGDVLSTHPTIYSCKHQMSKYIYGGTRATTHKKTIYVSFLSFLEYIDQYTFFD